MNKLLLGTMLMANTITPYRQDITKNAIIKTNYPNINVKVSGTFTSGISYAGNSNDVIEIDQFKQFNSGNLNNTETITMHTFTVIKPKLDYTNYEFYQHTDGNRLNYLKNRLETETIQNTSIDIRALRTRSAENITTIDNFITAFKDGSIDNQENTVLTNMINVCKTGTDIGLDYENAVDNLEEYANWENYGIDLNQGWYYVYFSELTITDVFAQDPIWQQGLDCTANLPTESEFRFWWNYTPTPTPPGEYIDLGDLFLTILGMPMAWITQAFNFTFWEGTAYALNVGHILSAVIIASIIIIIIKKVYK